MRSALFNGVIVDIRGPFFSSGNWWENNRWWREEWDIQTSDGNLYRIFRAAEEVGKTVGRARCPVRVAPRAAEAGLQVVPVRAALAPLSLTPRFSGVYKHPEVSINCFNSFMNPDSAGLLPLPVGRGWGEGVHGKGEERVPLQRHGFEYFIEGIYD